MSGQPTPAVRIEGGCDDCDAYSELVEVEPRMWVLAVRHDATCPYFRARQTRANH